MWCSVCTSVKVCQLWSFFARLCGTQQMCSVLPWGCRLSLSPSIHSLSSSSLIRTYPPMFIHRCSSDNKLTAVLIPLPSFGYFSSPLFYRSPSILYLSQLVTAHISFNHSLPRFDLTMFSVLFAACLLLNTHSHVCMLVSKRVSVEGFIANMVKCFFRGLLYFAREQFGSQLLSFQHIEIVTLVA